MLDVLPLDIRHAVEKMNNSDNLLEIILDLGRIPTVRFVDGEFNLRESEITRAEARNFYFGFILLIAYAKPLTGSLVAPGLSLGILLGALVIFGSWISTWIYVRWANTQYDARLETLKQETGR